ncbi:enoyl-CoA hydratase/isomerase family protein [Ornithinibacillus salinisoli]|uniref:Enoyl-CoA hydratase/isomerase family protein n=1 Tax=Ornithinibacillus salinisoli TaxID=1848459 RepID=A0ABW4VY28_9BACI
MDFKTIVYEVKESIATITLNRPSAYNAITAEMNMEITKALKMGNRDESVRCIVITGNGKAFCSGQDLAGVDEETNHATFLRERYHPMLKAMKQTHKPIVAAINGTAAGAGMSLALAADYRLMQPNAKFVSAFLNVGLIPDSGFLYMLPRLVGYANALEISTIDKPITGEEASGIGLVTKVINPTEWEEEVWAFAKQLAELPTTSFSLIKRYMIDGMHSELDVFLEQEAHAQRIAGLTKDHQEGLRAFVERRKPNFSGK